LAEGGETGCQGEGRQAIDDPPQQAGLETQGAQLGQAVVGALDLVLELLQHHTADLLDGPICRTIRESSRRGSCATRGERLLMLKAPAYPTGMINRSVDERRRASIPLQQRGDLVAAIALG